MQKIASLFAALVLIPIAFILGTPEPIKPWQIAPAFAQFGGIVPLDTQLCSTIGAIAVRNLTRWQCVNPGTPGQVFISNGAGVVPSWTTPAGTGNVNASGTPTANQVAVWTNATTVQGVSAGGTLLDLVSGFSAAGFVTRTGSNAYAIVANPLPVANGGTGQTSSGGAALDAVSGFTSNGILARTGAGAYTVLANPLPVANGGTGQTAAGGAALDAITSFSNTGFLKRTGSGTYAFINDPVPVANGGTGQTAAAGASLDAITGFTGTGIIQRTGSGAYSFSTFSQLHDTLTNCTTQGSIAYRNGTVWVCLSPGTAGQYLMTNGGGANPSWASPGTASPGTRVLLNTLNASNSPSLQDTTSISSSYVMYELECDNILPSVGGYSLVMLVQQNGSFATSGYVGGFSAINSSGAALTATSGSNMVLTGALSASTSYEGFAGKIFFNYPASGSLVTVKGFGGYTNTAPSPTTINYIYGTPPSAVTGFKLSMTSGNILSGTCKLYGSN